jgi:hypothetical protein
VKLRMWHELVHRFVLLARFSRTACQSLQRLLLDMGGYTRTGYDVAIGKTAPPLLFGGYASRGASESAPGRMGRTGVRARRRFGL